MAPKLQPERGCVSHPFPGSMYNFTEAQSSRSHGLPPGLCSCLDCGSLLLKQFIQLSVSAGPSVFVWRLCHSLCGCHPVSCLSSRPPQGNLSLSSSSLRNPLFPVFKLRQTSLVAIKLLWIVVFLKCPLHIGIFIFCCADRHLCSGSSTQLDKHDILIIAGESGLADTDYRI